MPECTYAISPTPPAGIAEITVATQPGKLETLDSLELSEARIIFLKTPTRIDATINAATTASGALITGFRVASISVNTKPNPPNEATKAAMMIGLKMETPGASLLSP